MKMICGCFVLGETPISGVFRRQAIDRVAAVVGIVLAQACADLSGSVAFRAINAPKILDRYAHLKPLVVKGEGDCGPKSTNQTFARLVFASA